MWRNYLKIAWRNMSKRKANTLINVLGLSSGMAVCLLLFLFIRDERSYDDFHAKKDRIYRVALDRLYPGRTTSYSFIPQSIGEAIAAEFPEVEQSCRIFSNRGFGSFYIRRDDKVFEEKDVLLADSNFFAVFTGEAVEGDLITALQKPNSMVLNESTALRYFGSTGAAMGKTLRIEENAYLVTGVCRNWPSNSHFDFDVLISSSTFIPPTQKNYVNFSAHTYLLLRPGSSAQQLEAKLPQIVNKYVSGEIARLFSQTYEQFVKSGNGYRYFLQPLTRIHLISALEGELGVNGSERTVSLFLLIAIFILVIACINFVNLSTARSLERAKEVGIRKTFGSKRSALILQFLYESVLIGLISLFTALLIVAISIPLFNSISGKSLSLFAILDPAVLAIVLAVAFATGLTAGIYPALVLSSFRPILVLKGKMQSSPRSALLRSGLVVFQFAVTVILIICTLVVNLQMRYMTGDKLGFDKDMVVTLERTDMLGDNPEAFKAEVMKIGGVAAVSGNSAMPGTQNFFGMSFRLEGGTEMHTGRGLMVDEQYQEVLGLELSRGRFFSKQFSTDTLSVVVNESAVLQLGITGDPIGKRLITPDGFLNAPDGSTYNYTIVGVVKDFHFQALHEKIAPLYMIHVRKLTPQDPLIAVKLRAANYQASINSMASVWKKFVQDRPLHFDLLDQKLAAMYTTEESTRKLFSIFSVLAIIIACMGMIGLIAYTIQLRFREIGIRKVLGASASGILWLLAKSFLVTVLLASLIAIPIGWWAMRRWLENFAYRVQIPVWVFILASCLAILIAAVNISLQALKAAWMSPVKSLRTE